MPHTAQEHTACWGVASTAEDGASGSPARSPGGPQSAPGPFSLAPPTLSGCMPTPAPLHPQMPSGPRPPEPSWARRRPPPTARPQAGRRSAVVSPTGRRSRARSPGRRRGAAPGDVGAARPWGPPGRAHVQGQQTPPAGPHSPVIAVARRARPPQPVLLPRPTCQSVRLATARGPSYHRPPCSARPIPEGPAPGARVVATSNPPGPARAEPAPSRKAPPPAYATSPQSPASEATGLQAPRASLPPGWDTEFSGGLSSGPHGIPPPPPGLGRHLSCKPCHPTTARAPPLRRRLRRNRPSPRPSPQPRPRPRRRLRDSQCAPPVWPRPRRHAPPWPRPVLAPPAPGGRAVGPGGRALPVTVRCSARGRCAPCLE